MSSMRWRQVGVVAAIVGAGISAYLLVEYVSNNSGLCLTGSGCDLVQQSAYAYPLGIPLPLFGVVFYLIAAWLGWRSLSARQILGLRPQLVLAVVALAGLAASAVLTGIEALVFHAFCTWCLAQAAASLVLAISALGLLIRSRFATQGTPSHSTARARKDAARRQGAARSLLVRTILVAAAVTGLTVALALGAGAVTRTQPTQSAAGSSDLAPSYAPRSGSGKVLVVEFADYQCPACAVVAPILGELAKEGSITLVYRNFPLPQHANAIPAARAAHAASALGKFWEMHDLLFQTQSRWESLPTSQTNSMFEQLAASIGLDAAAWRAGYESSAVLEPIDSDAAAAEALGLSATPSIYIDGQLYQGRLSESAIRAAIATS